MHCKGHAGRSRADLEGPSSTRALREHRVATLAHPANQSPACRDGQQLVNGPAALLRPSVQSTVSVPAHTPTQPHTHTPTTKRDPRFPLVAPWKKSEKKKERKKKKECTQRRRRTAFATYPAARDSRQHFPCSEHSLSRFAPRRPALRIPRRVSGSSRVTPSLSSQCRRHGAPAIAGTAHPRAGGRAHLRIGRGRPVRHHHGTPVPVPPGINTSRCAEWRLADADDDDDGCCRTGKPA